MGRVLFLLFLAIPLVELWLLIAIGGTIGGLNTILLVIGTALLGGFLARRQGFTVYSRMRMRIQAGEPIVDELFSAVALLFAGLMLLLPGVVTDILGFLLLIPYIRKKIYGFLQGAIRVMPNYGQRQYQEVVVDVDIHEDTQTPSSRPTIIHVDTTKEKE